MPGTAKESCCDQVSKTGVLQCRVDVEGQAIAGRSADLASLFQLSDGTPMLAWRRSVSDRWNYSHAKQLLVASDSDPRDNPVLATALESLPHTMRSFDLGQRHDAGLWLVDLADGGRFDAPLLALEAETGMTIYPVAILNSLGRAEATGPADDDPDWAWHRINAATAQAGDRRVRIALLDNGYFPDSYYDRIVEAKPDQDIIGAGTLVNTDDSHGAACLLYAAEPIMRSIGGADTVTLVPYRIFGVGSCTTEAIVIDAIDHVLQNHIDIVVAPWIITQENSRLEQEITRLEEQGILFLTGPANDPLNLDVCACAQQMAWWAPGNIGVVGAVAPDQDRWPYCWGHQRIDVGAPGESLHNRLTGAEHDSGSSFAVSIAGGMVAVELSSGQHADAVAAWRDLTGQPRVDRCRAHPAHGPCDHCAAEGVLHFQ